MKRKGKKDVFGDSPFLSKMEYRYVEMGEGVFYERVSNVRVFLDSFLNEVRDGMPLRSKEMFIWLLGRVRSGDDLVVINRRKYMEKMGIKSLPTVNVAINGLLWADVLGKSNVRGVYFINPVHFFRGSRVRKWPKQSAKWESVNNENNDEQFI
jgi:hypothetical protein